jgi:cell shape-determining protein MreD
MRTASQVLVAYAMLVVLGCLWRLLPLGPAPPDVVAVAAGYFGLTARRSLAGPVGGAVVVGYLGDLVIGAPVGLMAFVAGVVCLLGHLVHSRLLVRGWRMNVAFSAFVAVVAGLLIIVLRGIGDQQLSGAGSELARVLWSAIATAAIGPLVLRLMRRVDAAFARTHRERDAALEGLAP